MLFRLFCETVSLSFPFTVTFPALFGFVSWRWSPFQYLIVQPSFLKRSRTCLTLYLFISLIVWRYKDITFFNKFQIFDIIFFTFFQKIPAYLTTCGDPTLWTKKSKLVYHVFSSHFRAAQHPTASRTSRKQIRPKTMLKDCHLVNGLATSSMRVSVNVSVSVLWM